MKQKIRVMVVDDHAMVRLGLAQAIERESDMVLVGEAVNCKQALQYYKKLKPDVVTMDFKMPGEDGGKATAALRQENPEVKVLLLSIYEGSEDIWRAMQSGAMGYVSKAAEILEVISAIRTISGGQRYFSDGLETKLAARESSESLTPRELDVLHQIVSGRSNKEIMDKLNMSSSTVKHHVEKIFLKLEVVDRTQAAILAVQRGIIHF